MEDCANATLAGAVITLFGYLPLLLNPDKETGTDQMPGSRSHRNQRTPRFHSAGSHLPDMSTMEEGNSGAVAGPGMSNFKSYSNPYAIVEDTGTEYIQPALMPNVCARNSCFVGVSLIISR